MLLCVVAKDLSSGAADTIDASSTDVNGETSKNGIGVDLNRAWILEVEYLFEV